MTSDSADTDHDPHTVHGATRPRLVRHPSDRVIAGVAGGLGAYFGIDAVILRILFVVFTFAAGSGIVLYLVGWLLIPDAGADASLAERAVRDTSRGRHTWQTWLGIGLIVLAAALLLDDLYLFPRLTPASIVLVGLGALLLWQGRTDDAAGPAHPDDPDGDRTPAGPAGTRTAVPPAAGAAAAGHANGGGAPPRWQPPAPPDAPPPAPPRPRSILGRVTMGVLLVAVGGVALLEALGVADVTGVGYLSLAVTILGLGLVVGGWWGRARWLMIPAFLLLPALLVASLAPMPLRGGVGERHVNPRTAADVEPSYALVAGQLTINLRDIEPGVEETVPVEARVNFGELIVLVPDDATVTVTADSRIGEVAVLGRRNEGVGADLEVTDAPPDQAAGTGRFLLDLDVGVGSIEVRRDDAFGGSLDGRFGPGAFGRDDVGSTTGRGVDDLDLDPADLERNDR